MKSSTITGSDVTRILALTLGLSTLGITSTASAATELVVNGGFEAPVIATGTYSFLSTISGWTLDPSSLGTSFEVRNNFNTPYEGNQFIELNSDNTTSISQNLATTAGDVYELSFAFSPRPGYAQNIMRIYWDGALVDTLSASGVGNTDNAWKVYTYNLTATSSSTHLAFDDLLETNVLPGGSHLDAVSVQGVPEPSTLALLGLGMIGILKRRR